MIAIENLIRINQTLTKIFVLGNTVKTHMNGHSHPDYETAPGFFVMFTVSEILNIAGPNRLCKSTGVRSNYL
jgi:hypothetical protein